MSLFHREQKNNNMPYLLPSKSILSSPSVPSYSINRNAYILYLPYIVSRDGHALLPSEENLLHAMNRLCNPSLRRRRIRRLLLRRYSIGNGAKLSSPRVTGAQLALFIITLSTSRIFDAHAAPSDPFTSPMQRSPRSPLPRRATRSRRGKCFSTSA